MEIRSKQIHPQSTQKQNVQNQNLSQLGKNHIPDVESSGLYAMQTFEPTRNAGVRQLTPPLWRRKIQKTRLHCPIQNNSQLLKQYHPGGKFVRPQYENEEYYLEKYTAVESFQLPV